MNRHLNNAEMSAAVTGQAGADAAVHLESCAACRSEVEQFENVLGQFRGGVRNWSDGQFSGNVAVQPRSRWWRGLGYAGAVAAILLVFLFAQWRRAPIATHIGESDTVLLKQVNADVSRSAPSGMETLLGFTSVSDTATQR